MDNVAIYGLICPIERRVRYVGKSHNPERRLYQHLYRSQSERHYENTHLHRWLKLLQRAERAPSLVILETVDIKSWIERERYWISHFGLAELCNMNAGGFEPPSATGRVWSKQTHRRYSLARKGKHIWIGDKIHPMKGKIHPSRGKKRSAEFCEKIRQAKLKYNPMKGKPVSEYRKVLLRLRHSKPIVQIDEDGQILKSFGSALEAARELKLPHGAISRVCSGEYKQTHGYRFRF